MNLVLSANDVESDDDSSGLLMDELYGLFCAIYQSLSSLILIKDYIYVILTYDSNKELLCERPFHDRSFKVHPELLMFFASL